MENRVSSKLFSSIHLLNAYLKTAFSNPNILSHPRGIGILRHQYPKLGWAAPSAVGFAGRNA